MATSNNWLKILILIVLSSFLIVRSTNLESDRTSDAKAVIIDCTLGLLTGKLLSLVSSTEPPEKFANSLLDLLIGWGVLLLVWYLPVWFPALKSTEYGFTINLLESPVVLWTAVAVLFGYFHGLTLAVVYTIPVALWNRIKRGEINRSILSFWSGLKRITGVT